MKVEIDYVDSPRWDSFVNVNGMDYHHRRVHSHHVMKCRGIDTVWSWPMAAVIWLIVVCVFVSGSGRTYPLSMALL